MTSIQLLANTAIERLRKEKKISREDMALHLDISLEAYRKIENGTTKLSLDRLAQICEVLGVNILDVLSQNNEKYHFREVKDNNIGVNTGTIHQNEDKSIKERLCRLEEQIGHLTLLVNKALTKDL